LLTSALRKAAALVVNATPAPVVAPKVSEAAGVSGVSWEGSGWNAMIWSVQSVSLMRVSLRGSWSGWAR
jgi:hypothetical protein